MKQWNQVSPTEWEYLNKDGIVMGVVERTPTNSWEWDGPTTLDSGIERHRHLAMDRVEHVVNLRVN